MSDQQPDWDKITEGKIRHGVAVEAFSKGMELNSENMKEIEKWVQFIIHGYDGIKDILDQAKESKPINNKELKDALVDAFDDEVIKDKNKVLYQLKNGNITLDNLQACLDKIGTMKHF